MGVKRQREKDNIFSLPLLLSLEVVGAESQRAQKRGLMDSGSAAGTEAGRCGGLLGSAQVSGYGSCGSRDKSRSLEAQLQLQ